jgi:hypothetical protein
LATSTRQPSRSNGGRSQRPAIEPGPASSRRRSSAEEKRNLGRLEWPSQLS